MGWVGLTLPLVLYGMTMASLRLGFGASGVSIAQSADLRGTNLGKRARSWAHARLRLVVCGAQCVSTFEREAGKAEPGAALTRAPPASRRRLPACAAAPAVPARHCKRVSQGEPLSGTLACSRSKQEQAGARWSKPNNRSLCPIVHRCRWHTACSCTGWAPPASRSLYRCASRAQAGLVLCFDDTIAVRAAHSRLCQRPFPSSHESPMTQCRFPYARRRRRPSGTQPCASCSVPPPAGLLALHPPPAPPLAWALPRLASWALPRQPCPRQQLLPRQPLRLAGQRCLAGPSCPPSCSTGWLRRRTQTCS
jgi:hypothetical protein